MPDLFDTPVLEIEGSASQHDFRLMDAQGTVLANVFKLMDASGRHLANATYESVSLRQGPVEQYPEGGRYCLYTDMNGVEIGRMDVAKRSTLRLPYLLPDPLRLLVIASPLAFGLLAGDA